MSIEEVGDKGKVELRVTGDKRLRSKELAASKPVCILKNVLGALEEISVLERISVTAILSADLGKEDCVVLPVFDISREVGYPNINSLLADSNLGKA